MTEKQYKVGYFEDPNPVDDYVETIDGEYLNATDAVKLLNKLSKENEQLKTMNISYNFDVDDSGNIVIELLDSESNYGTGAEISREYMDYLKDDQYDIYREISYCTFKALLRLVRRINSEESGVLND